MKAPAIRRFRRTSFARHRERGITMLLVAAAMVAIIGMAALSIDVVTLYLAREEAQRSADAAALAAARVLSLSGVTGDPDNTTGNWPNACSTAAQVAQAVANQNAVGSTAPSTVNVNFMYKGTAVANCSFAGANAFGVNPQVQVQVIRGGLPTLFSRIWSRNPNSVSATATAEAFNSSASGAVAPGGIVPVNPRCVKPWIIPNKDPGNAGNPFVNLGDGSILNPGIQVNGAGTGVIGETFLLSDACSGPDCDNMNSSAPAVGSYVPAYVTSNASAYPTCADDSVYQTAVGGCDQTTPYECGVSTAAGSQARADLTINPKNDTFAAAQCLLRQPGQDSIDTTVFPYQIKAGANNPVINTGAVTSSRSIVTVPIYDGAALSAVNYPPVTIVGFLQVFVNQANGDGSLSVTVLNVAGCSNAATNPPVPASGTSPVPIRLITPQ
ncbi:MAG: pilus assembly protein TadG-related protein [Candidatus Sulfotelmatobacter sp.]